jgi:hypothetical protein
MDAISRLPDEAQTKFEIVRMEAIDARDAAIDLTQKLKDAEYEAEGTDPSAANKTRIALLRTRLQEAQARDFAMRNLVSNLSLFIQRAANNSAITIWPFDRRSLPKKKRSGDAKEALASIRAEIEETKNAIGAIERAPIAGKSKRAATKKYMEGLLAKGQPKVRVDHNGEVHFRLGAGADSVALADARGHHLLGMMLNLFGIEAVLDKVAPREPDREDAITPAQRDERLTELRDRLLLLEREEESLIDSSGILRRADADPRAVLQIEAPRLRSLAA